ncbi:MAG: transferase, partial [Nocardioidaceae bacterium]|nr:transferase [Nocardioidaceae bacterium]
AWFEEQGAEAVGFGWINLRRTDAEPVLRLEDWPYDVTLPLGDEVADHFARTEQLRSIHDRDLMFERPRRVADVVQETLGEPGAEDPATILVRRQRGIRRARQVTTAEAALVGACDGELSLFALSRAIDELLGTATDLAPVVRELVADGFLTLS